ncbi:flagellar biosynthesis protein FliQ [Roseospira goensis]|uniref:Flagellar biosynthetic protein FliQ n=1 Tax=Roseospira goensis TaxID=391922 RepID=A0A7W6RZV9_9PROT|nr:flagellar biosynthesis protein FliQ [Roseospira goensis]MBB4286151.1 flagellar biosynthetic protein FliQ [Roseospira goensis]
MEETQILDVARDGIYTMILVAAPIMLAGLVVGLIISLFQTLTQIQEMTLVFVPKILVVFIAMLFFLPYMIQQLTEITERLMDLVVSLP